jgi:hypothetical protein
MFSLGRISAACIYTSIYVFGRLFTYRLASVFQLVLSLSSISAACIQLYLCIRMDPCMYLAYCSLTSRPAYSNVV